MDIKRMVEIAHDTTKEKGFYDGDPRTPLEVHALIHSEISEATEQVREGRLPYYEDGEGKPEGEAVELADAIIRIADYFGFMGWDLNDIITKKMIFNKSRPHRHGGKSK